MHARAFTTWSLAFAALLVACGGSGKSTSGGGTVAGNVVKGAVAGAGVTAFAVNGGTLGAQLGQATTDSAGAFTVPIGSYSGPLVLQASGGTFDDEATGASMSMLDGDVMTCALSSVTANGATSGVQVTPLTSMAQAAAHAMTGGMTAGNIDAANAAVGSYFSVGDIVHTAPIDPTWAGSGSGVTADVRNYAMSIAAMSELARTLGMTSSSAMVTAMTSDASDGVMDGMMGTASVSMAGMGGLMGVPMEASAGTTGLAQAMETFIGSTMNKSGVTLADMQPLIDRLAGSNGQLVSTGGGTTGMMSGTASKGPVAGATVTAYALANGAVGAQLGSAVTDATGGFAIPLGSYAGAVMLQLKGGTYTDEATGSAMSMLAGDVLTACVPAVSPGLASAAVQLDPLTTMAQARAQAMSGGMTANNITAANSAVGEYFSAGDILHTKPIDPLVSGSGSGATADARNAGMVIAAMSEYARSAGMMTSSSGMVTLMAKDASDGVMNGMMGSTAISMTGMGGMMGGTMSTTAGTTDLAAAMTTFVGSAMNRSGVQMADMQPLIDALTSSDGHLPAAGGGI